MVSSDGSREAVETLRDLERLYHSSGTQNLKERVAEGERGLGVTGACMAWNRGREDGSLVVSGVILEE
jgi:hypothetical protein